jgi:hypothetical protein
MDTRRLFDMADRPGGISIDELVSVAGPEVAAKMLATTHTGIIPYGRQTFVQGHGAALCISSNTNRISNDVRQSFTDTPQTAIPASQPTNTRISNDVTAVKSNTRNPVLMAIAATRPSIGTANVRPDFKLSADDIVHTRQDAPIGTYPDFDTAGRSDPAPGSPEKTART